MGLFFPLLAGPFILFIILIGIFSFFAFLFGGSLAVALNRDPAQLAEMVVSFSVAVGIIGLVIGVFFFL